MDAELQGVAKLSGNQDKYFNVIFKKKSKLMSKHKMNKKINQDLK